VSSGAEALTALQTAQQQGRPFPLVLTDFHMQGMDGFVLTEQIRKQPELAQTSVVMLSSAGEKEDSVRCEELEIIAYLIKPVRRSRLLDAILEALGKSHPARKVPAGPSTSVPRPIRPLRVLLAEDGLVNQKLAVGLLQKYGHQVVVAGNGQEAIEALQSREFDLVLMDVQMPGMDGLQATRRIRAAETESHRRIPIIAMTAHAMKGDRERCLAAGMDEYLAKPLKADDLYATIECVLRRQAVVDLSCDSPPIDLDAALNTVEGDKDLLADLVDIFLHSYPTDMIALGKAIDSGDARELTRAAHSLKGAFGSIGAIKAQALAREIESLGRSTRLEGASSAFQQLKDELEHITTFFAEPSWRAH
jgi:CheY-like chemotaxis protein/HPt (histidine-containing phosphotransfer) domain-containing protein